MAEIVSLRTARKRKARGEKERTAEENRILHGRPRAERLANRSRREREEAAHEGHRREPPQSDSEQ